MKMKPIDRVLLALYALVGMLALAYAALNAAMPDRFLALNQAFANAISAQPALPIALISAGVVFLAWSVRVLVLAFKHEPRYDKTSVSIQNTENGAVRVSVAAMDTLVKQAIGQAEGVVDIKTRIINHEDSITVKIDMSLAADAHIPNVTMLMQRSIKSFIEEFSGIAVREVEIMVTAIQPVEHPVAALPDRQTEPRIESKPVEPEPVPEPVPTEDPESNPELESVPVPQPVSEPEEPEAWGEADKLLYEVAQDDEPESTDPANPDRRPADGDEPVE